MYRLPPALRDVLLRAPRVVVAPVGIGYGQSALRRWAEEVGRAVVESPQELRNGASLLLYPKRSGLAFIPPDIPLADLLLLPESDAEYSRAEWRDGLPGSTVEFAEWTFEQCEGWPFGFELARRIVDTDVPLHQHPLAAVALERLLPHGPSREAMVRAAATPVLTPDLRRMLGVGQIEVEELLDQGYLRPLRAGLALPKLLRRYLLPMPDEATARRVAEALASRGQLDDALVALSEAELWDAYLELLSEGFQAGGRDGEARLRSALRVLPRETHDSGEYRYLVGTLERMRGDLAGAQERYRIAVEVEGLSPGMKARIDNARGIVFALQGELKAADRAFGAAVKGATSAASHPNRARLEGEARHNRAGVAIQQGRFSEAEKDLRRAVTNFREAADYVREARSLQLLALSWHRRGLFQEAKQGYAEALELLATLGQQTALLRANLAEVLVLMGRTDEAKAQLDAASREAGHDSRVRGYLEANLGLCRLSEGQVELAVRQLRSLLRREGLESHLQAEVNLLLARALRTSGDNDAALEHARAAAPVGVAAELELALCLEGPLEPVIERAREEEARFELATALLNRAGEADLEEALQLIRAHEYRILLDAPKHAPKLAALARNDRALTELFPLSMTTFGGFSVRFLGFTLTLAAFPTRKSAALLLRLALAARPLSREALADEFWGDARNPLHSLQTAFYHLNRTLQVQVVGGRKGTAELIYPVEVDLTRFERSASDAVEASWTGGGNLHQALALASGEALAEFPEWFDEERRRTEELKLRLWRRLAEESSEPDESAGAFEALLRLDPFEVAARRRLIELYDRLGDGERARRHRERLRSLTAEL